MLHTTNGFWQVQKRICHMANPILCEVMALRKPFKTRAAKHFAGEK
jgi:hypothetical protein